MSKKNGQTAISKKYRKEIKYAKKKSFQSLAISTIADPLDEEKQVKLIESEIDIVIFSIDGIKK